MVKQLIIRLQRNKLYKKPQYKVVVMFKSNAVKAAPLAILGKFVPQYPQKFFFIDLARLAFWLHKGAVVSNTVVKLIGRLSHNYNKVPTSFIHMNKNKVDRILYKKQTRFFEKFLDNEAFIASKPGTFSKRFEKKMLFLTLKARKSYKLKKKNYE